MNVRCSPPFPRRAPFPNILTILAVEWFSLLVPYPYYTFPPRKEHLGHVVQTFSFFRLSFFPGFPYPRSSFFFPPCDITSRSPPCSFDGLFSPRNDRKAPFFRSPFFPCSVRFLPFPLTGNFRILQTGTMSSFSGGSLGLVFLPSFSAHGGRHAFLFGIASFFQWHRQVPFFLFQNLNAKRCASNS